MPYRYPWGLLRRLKNLVGAHRALPEKAMLFSANGSGGQGKGIVLEQRAEGETYEVRAFETLSDSIASYSRNLNVHPSYGMFRVERARRSGEPDNPSNGYKFTETLMTYSERSQDYVNALQNLIQANRFDQLENTQLVRERLAGNCF